MNTHTTPPTDHDHTGPAAEPARRASRFDQRGIALQTVIIMVVLLAIAGGVAAVLLTRGQEAANQLESQAVTAYTDAEILEIDNFRFCVAAGGYPSTEPKGTKPTAAQRATASDFASCWHSPDDLAT